MQIDWGASYSTTTEDTPDLRLFATFKEPRFDIPPIVIPFPVTYDYNLGNNALGLVRTPTVYWRALEGDNLNLTFDDKIPFQQWGGLDSFLKFGVYFSGSEQTFSEQAYTFRSDNDYAAFKADGDPNSFLNDPRITPNAAGRFGAYVVDYQTRTSFEGTLDVPATYLMTDLALAKPLKLVGGVRLEKTDQEVVTTTTDGSKPPVTTTGQIETTDWLPAAGLIYSVIPTMNVRLNYSKTVARPTFRELADAEYVNFAGGNTFSGNPNLNRSRADNYDLRWEWFPEPGDVLAASAFYKKIVEPIELVQRNDQGTIQPENSEEAEVYGLELELRKNLGFIHSSIQYFSLGANYAWIKSEVPRPFSETVNRPFVDPVRPLYDQPTYVFNADLTYDNPNLGTTATLSFNVTGRRLARTDYRLPDIYSESVPVLNFTVSQRLWKNWTLGFSAKNLLNPTVREVYDYEQTPAGGDIYNEFTTGMTFGVTLSYTF
jgi:TonB-dependent receptor